MSPAGTKPSSMNLDPSILMQRSGSAVLIVAIPVQDLHSLVVLRFITGNILFAGVPSDHTEAFARQHNVHTW